MQKIFLLTVLRTVTFKKIQIFAEYLFTSHNYGPNKGEPYTQTYRDRPSLQTRFDKTDTFVNNSIAF